MQQCVNMVGLVVAITFGGDHGVMDVSCVLGTLTCHDCLCRCIVGGVGLDLVSSYDNVSSWFEEIDILMS
jgi:hypothetical protein